MRHSAPPGDIMRDRGSTGPLRPGPALTEANFLCSFYRIWVLGETWGRKKTRDTGVGSAVGGWRGVPWANGGIIRYALGVGRMRKKMGPEERGDADSL